MSKDSEWLWSGLELALSIAPLILGYRVVLWLMAKPIEMLPATVSLGGSCPAFRYEHSQYFCEPLGTTQAHPWLFVGALACIALCLASAAAIHLTGRSGKQAFVERVIIALKSKLHSA